MITEDRLDDVTCALYDALSHAEAACKLVISKRYYEIIDELEEIVAALNVGVDAVLGDQPNGATGKGPQA